MLQSRRQRAIGDMAGQGDSECVRVEGKQVPGYEGAEEWF
jgi:hypothetical protein